MGIQGLTLTWIQNFLQGHSFHVVVGASVSTPWPILRGIPNSSILSPLLFNVLLSELSLPTYSHLVYADDITIISRAPTHTEAQELLQEAATALGDWVTTLGLTVSAQKSATICFILRSSPASPLIILCGEAVPYTTTHIFLGLQLYSTHLS